MAMRTGLIVFCLILAIPEMLLADGGAIQFQGDAGSFHVTLFTQPPILRAGLIDITMLVQDRSNLDPILDAKVTFHLNRQAGSLPEATQWMPPACAMNKTADLSNIPALLGHGENRLLYGSAVQVSDSGRWEFKAQIQRAGETAEIDTGLNIGLAPPPPMAYWHLFLLIPAAILGFVLHQWARAQRTKAISPPTGA